MHLRALRLRGFKSFAEPTEVRFEPGVAVVIGPNGSGKSNIAEALKWAMASQPPSELRLTTAADVLFGGSAARAPSGLCEVELVLDDVDDGPDARAPASGPLGRPELSIMRRLRRDGESAYLLNRVAVRRLDVQEALADVGLGRELHAIISQGRVEEVLLSRPGERRGLIEEAAGLGKYKRRRHRAAQKLARVEANLVRARDVERELAARLRPLALQASAASRAAELRRELDEARLTVLASDIADGRRRRAALAADLARARGELERLEGERSRASAQRGDVERELAGLAAEQERAAATFWALGGGLERLDARRGSLAERVEALDDDGRRLRGRLERLGQEAVRAREAAAAAAHEAEQQAARLGALADGGGDADLAALEAAASGALEAALAARRRLAELDGRRERAAAEARLATARAGEARARAGRLGGEVERRATGRESAERSLEAAHGRLTEAEQAAAAAADAETRAVAATAAAASGEQAARSEQAGLDERAAAARARVETSRQALERGDGLSPALRRLRGRGVALAVDLVDAVPGLELAVAAALEWRAAEAFADEAGAAVALLADDDLAGAALLCLDRVPARAAPSVGRPLADFAELRPGAPAALLDGVHLVEEPADLLAARTGVVVLADGRGFDADRGVAFRAGSASAATLVLRRDLEEATRALAAAERARETASARHAAARAAREGAAAVERRRREEQAEARRGLEAAARALRDARRLADAEARAHDAERARLEAAGDEERRLRAAAADGEAEAQELGRERLEAERRTAALEQEHAAADERRRAVHERMAGVRAERAAVAERLARARAEHERSSAIAAGSERRAALARHRADRLDALRAALAPAVATLAAAAERARELRQPERDRLDALEGRTGEASSTLAALARTDEALTRSAGEAASRVARVEVAAAQLEERLAELGRRRREVAEHADVAVVDRVEPLPADELAELAARIERLERRRQQLGAVNPLAQEEYEEAKERLDEAAEGIADLEAALRELRSLVRELTATIAARFEETFADVEANFAEVVETLFPGGRGRLRLVADVPVADDVGEPAEPGDGAVEPREPGVELEVQPAGKRIASLGILSGGEKALGAIAFLWALMLARPCPFYVLDEVEAALDDANIDRFLALVERFRDRAQLIVITHQKRTMEVADALYGVTMAGDGVSRVVSRRLPRDADVRRGILNPA